ncbi:MAG: hypothetical protein AAF517_19760 [Planctomycetota bacterium]
MKKSRRRKKLSDVERFERARERIKRRAQRMGESQHRRRSGFRQFDLKAEIHRELADLRDVFERHPDCAQAVDEIHRFHHSLGMQRRLDADRFAVALAGHLRGVAIQYHAIVAILIARPAEELPLILRAYEDRYHETFRHAFDRVARTPGMRVMNTILGRDVLTERTRLEHLLNGKRAAAFADTIYLALRWRWGKDERAVSSVLHKIVADPNSEELMAEVNEEYRQRYHGRFGVETMAEALEKQLPLTHWKRAEALLDGNPARETVLHLSGELERWRPRVPKIDELLRDRTAEERRAIRLEWSRMRGRSIANELGNRKWKPRLRPVRDFTVALLDGKTTTADAAFLRAAVARLPGCWIGQPFVGRASGERRTLIAHYERTYGRSFWLDLRRTVGDRTRSVLMESFVRRGRLSDAELLRDCMHGFGTDEGGIKEVLERSDEENIRAIEEEYRKFRRYDFLEGLRVRPVLFVRQVLATMWEVVRESDGRSFRKCFQRRSLVPRDLWMDLEAELDGDDWLDAQLLRDGKPSDPVALYHRTAVLYEHERGGRFSKAIDWICHDGEAMDRDFKKARAYFDARIDGKDPSEEELHRLGTLVAYASHAFESFRSAKHSLSFVLANVLSGLAVGVVAIAALSSKQPLWVVMAGCFLVSATTRMVCRWTLSARGYGRERMAQDVALATVDGLTFAAGTAARQLFGGIGRRILRSKVTHRIIKSTSSFVLKRLVRTSQELSEKKSSAYLKHAKGTDGTLQSEERDIAEVLERLSIYA